MLPAKLCRLVGLYAVFAVWSACEIHERTEQQLADGWKAAAGGIRVRYHDPFDPVTISAKNRLCLQPVMTSGMSCVCAPRLGEVSRTVAAM